MTDTMSVMELIKADTLLVYSLEVGDLINHENEIVEIIDISQDQTGDNYYLTLINDFGEETVASYSYDYFVDFYVMIE
jgi:hypothetical protein